MTDDQPTALAREFSKEHDDSTIAYHAAKDVINFLLRRFCLVEKEAIRKEYKQAAEDYDPYDPMYSNRGKLDLLESIFPEIAKEAQK